MGSLTDALTEVRDSAARAKSLVQGSSQARQAGNVGLADTLIQQAQVESQRAQSAAQYAANAPPGQVQQEAYSMAKRGVLGAVPWWGWLAGGLGVLYVGSRALKGRGGARRGRR